MAKVLLGTLLAGFVAVSATQPLAAGAHQAPAQPSSSSVSTQRALLDRYCVTCHNGRTKSGNLALDTLDVSNLGLEPGTWEKVTRKLKAGVMPPAGRPRPDEPQRDAFVAWLENGLDALAAKHPNPGRTEAFHRLNRVEYRNTIRDLLAIDIDVDDYLPLDDASYGFDNIAGVLKISQTLLERYLSTAKTISRMAVGGAPPAVDSDTYRIQQDAQQHAQLEGLPFGTRGGILVTHVFPQDAEYAFRLELGGGRAVSREEFKLEVTVDGAPVKLFTIGPRETRAYSNAYDDPDKLDVRVRITAGPHEIGAAFYQKANVLVEQVREPFQNPRISGNDGGPGGAQPALTSLRVMGPYDATGPGDTPSRRRVFTCRPGAGSAARTCAKNILGRLARLAYRGPVRADDLNALLAFYDEGAQSGSFEAGVELAIRRMLVDPLFLYRVEADPPASPPPGGVYRVGNIDLASRLSFFLWSSIPDDELLTAAERGTLSRPEVVRAQVKRMLADPRSDALTSNFAGQWLQLRNMDTATPGDPFSLTFNDSLRRDLKRETELLFASIVREDRSVMELLTADYTFLNERVAQHYGIPNIQGTHFRRVALPENSPRRGILGHGSILTITSHAIRTSPVFRGKWVLNNVLGTPPPEPPPNVPALVDKKTQARTLSVRERMAQHRANPSCAACHSLIDPAGFALEHFDAIGRWREVDESYNRIDATGTLPDGTTFDGVAQLRVALASRPERFVTTMTEKLLTYALGRGVEYYDMPAVRVVVKAAAKNGYRFESIVLGVVQSPPFQMRRAGS